MPTPANVLAISPVLLAEVESHARETYPEECCGVLLGSAKEADTSRMAKVEEVWPTPNGEPTHRTKGYFIAPEVLLDAYQQARNRGQEVIGYYHSHPGESALPSSRDLADAAPGVSYLIVSVGRTGVREWRSWYLNPGHSSFHEEQLI